MGIKERRDSEKSEMKQKIRDAAIEIINEDGYESLSIRKIAARIEYSPTTIYLYYKDKAQIIADMADQLYQKVENNAAGIISDNASADKQIHNILFNFIKTLSNEPEMTKAVIYSGTSIIFANDNKTPYPTNNGLRMLDELLAKGIAQKIFKPDINNTSWMIISGLLGFVISAVENQIYQLENFDDLVDTFVKILLGGIRD